MQHLRSLLIIATIVVALGSEAYGANRYWVGASSASWNDPANWSATSGGPGGASVPSASDTAVFDGNGNVNCNIDVNATVARFRILSGYTAAITQLAGQTLTIGSGGFEQTDGTFNGGNQTIDIQGAFTLSGGSFTATSGTLYVGHRSYGSASTTIFHISGGTFNHNNGLVTFAPNGYGGRNYTVDVTPGTRFYDVKVDVGIYDNTYLSVATGDTIYALNNITHQDGSIKGRLALEGNLIIGNEAVSGTGWIIFTKNANQTWEYTGTARTTAGIIIDKPAGNVAPKTGTNQLFCSRFELRNGTFNAPTGEMRLTHNWYSASITVFKRTGGTFNHNNGLVTFAPNGYGGRNYTVDVTPGTRFYDVKVDVGIYDNTYLSVATGDTIYALNNITHQDGSIKGRLALEGNLIIGNEAVSGTGWIIFTKNANQTWEYTGTARTTAGIIIDKPAGNVAPKTGTNQLFCSRFELRNGTFNAPTGEMRLTHNWYSASITVFKRTGGTFNHNNGLVTFAPNGYGGRTYSVDVTPGTRFYDVKVDVGNYDNTYLGVASGDTVYALHNLILNDGNSNGGNLAAEGNVTVQSSFKGGNSRLIFTGSQPQTFDLTGATGNFNGDIQLLKSAGNVTLLSECLLDAANQDIYFDSGDLITSSTNLLILGDNVGAHHMSDSSFVEGPVQKIGNDAFTFPVGKNDTIYAPISISAPASDTDRFTAEYFAVCAHDDGYDTTLHPPSIQRFSQKEYWTLNRTKGVSSVTVTLSWDTTRSGKVTKPADLLVARWNGSSWDNEGNGGTTGTLEAGMVSTAGPVSSFSPFTLGSSSRHNPLPVELLSFDAYLEGRQVMLRWRTASERNSDHFLVQRSDDLRRWREVARVPAAGNAVSVRHYSAVDPSPQTGVNYYRLKQVDQDGTFTYSSVIAVTMHAPQEDIAVYPLPARPGEALHIDVSTLEGSAGDVTLQAVNGQVIYQAHWNAEDAGRRTISMPISPHLPAGVYLLRLAMPDRSIVQKVIVK